MLSNEMEKKRMKNILIISSSPRKKGNSQILCEQFKKGAEAKGHQVNMVQSLRRLYEKWRYLCIKR